MITTNLPDWRMFEAMGDPNRLRLLKALPPPGGPSIGVTQIANIIGITQPAASKHLRKLEDVGLAWSTRQGQWKTYWKNPEGLEKAPQAFLKIFQDDIQDIAS